MVYDLGTTAPSGETKQAVDTLHFSNTLHILFPVAHRVNVL